MDDESMNTKEEYEPDVRRASRLRATPAAARGQQAAGASAEPLRPAQQALFDEAVADDGNVVVVAGTGFGKTRVAFAVVQAALLRHPRRLVVFLCPTVPLANQQRDYWERCGFGGGGGGGGRLTSAVVAGAGGAGFGAAHVTFATPAKFVASASSDPRGLAGLALLVVDECHHAHRKRTRNQPFACSPSLFSDRWRVVLRVAFRFPGRFSDVWHLVSGATGSSATGSSHHPYTEIADLYCDHVAHARPKLLGLTASPGATHNDVAGLAAVLQARFICAARGGVAETEAVVAGGESGRRLAQRLMRIERVVKASQEEMKGEKMGQLIGLAALWRAVGSGAVLHTACAGLEGADE